MYLNNVSIDVRNPQFGKYKGMGGTGRGGMQILRFPKHSFWYSHGICKVCIG